LSKRGPGRRRVTLVGSWLGGVALVCWGLFRTGALPAAAAARIGTGAGAAAVAFLVVTSSWPRGGRRRSFEELLKEEPAEPVARPPQLVEIELAMRLATFTSGRAAAELRLRPLVLEAARHRLRAHRGIDIAAMPAEARVVMGERLWGFLTQGAALPERDGPGLSPGEVEALVRDVCAL
jgi:hypothetical protein